MLLENKTQYLGAFLPGLWNFLETGSTVTPKAEADLAHDTELTNNALQAVNDKIDAFLKNPPKEPSLIPGLHNNYLIGGVLVATIVIVTIKKRKK